MSKNISIRDGSQSRYFTASKLRTNLQGGGTCDWVPLDEAGNYVELEELHVTENGTYYPSEKVGISAVYVDVPQQGSSVVPSGVSVRATAAENLTAGDCVYIISGGSGGTAGTTPSVFTGNSYMKVATDGTYVYYVESGNATEIKRIAISNLNGTPETYLSGLKNVRINSRNIISYQLTDNTYVLENVKMGLRLTGYSLDNIAWLSSPNYIKLSMPSRGYYGINDLNSAYSLGSTGLTDFLLNPTDYVKINNQYGYTHIKNGVSTSVSADTQFLQTLGYSAVVNNKLIVWSYNKNASNKYELLYFDLNADDGVAHNLKDGNNNNIESASRNFMKFNDAGNILLIAGGSGVGLIMVKSDFSVAIYDNITGTDNQSEMFGNYYYDRSLKQVFFVPQDAVMGKTNAKSHDGSLGYVASDVAAGTVGTATEMFR